MSTCPPQQLWHDLGRSWTLMLIDTIRNGHTGFNELQDELGISSKVLSERLSMLEEHELINKHEYEEDNQQRSKYTPTEKAQDLYGLIDEYKVFVKKYDASLVCGEKSCVECPYVAQKAH